MNAAAGLIGHEIRVPGSVSNLGPGFDSLSVAVQLYLRVRIVEVRPDLPDFIETRFVGAAPGGENRIETAFRHARARIGTPSPGVRIEAGSDIPTRAGLGSSGAATMAGLLLYQRLTSPIDAADLLALAADVEGHPDNAAAALLGGLTVSCQRDDGRVTARAWPWPAAVADGGRDAGRRARNGARPARASRHRPAAGRGVQPPARAAARARAGVGRPRRSARGAARSLAPAGARAARPRAVRSARARRRRGPRRLPQRRRAVDRGVHRAAVPPRRRRG